MLCPELDNKYNWKIIMEKFGIYFMTDGDGFEINLQPVNENTAKIYLELLSCFGEIEANCLKISSEQKVTKELKYKISEFVDNYAINQPVLNRFKRKINNLHIGQYFLVLKDIPTETSDRIKFETYISTRNEFTDSKEFQDKLDEKIKLLDEFSGDFLNKYNIKIPRNDRRTIIGNSKKTDRCCRFCGMSMADNVTFKKVAHAIPEGLGNKNIILGDECDNCNEYFGNEIEPFLIEYLDIYRVFLGVKGKNGTPKIKYKNGHIEFDESIAVVASQDTEVLSDKEIKVHLKSSKKFLPVKLYKALCKITLSTIDDEDISSLSKTIDWLKDSYSSEYKLPKVAINVVHNGYSKEPQVVNYIRKVDSQDIPHIVSEFRIGSFVYVYVIPFSDKDTKDFVDTETYQHYWNTFRHYNAANGWMFDCFDSTKETTINETIRLVKSEKA